MKKIQISKEDDRPIYPDELEAHGVVVNGIQVIPPILKKTMNNIRSKRRVTYQKSGKYVFYYVSDLVEFISKSRVEAIA